MHLPRQQPLPLPQVGACWPRCTSSACQLCSLKAPLSCMPQLKSAPPAGDTSSFAQAAAQANAQVQTVTFCIHSLATVLTHMSLSSRAFGCSCCHADAIHADCLAAAHLQFHVPSFFWASALASAQASGNSGAANAVAQVYVCQLKEHHHCSDACPSLCICVAGSKLANPVQIHALIPAGQSRSHS